MEPSLVARVLVGAASVDGGPTAEQLDVVGGLLDGLLDAAVDARSVEAVEADEIGPVEATERRRLGQMLAMVALCRHPLTIEQIDRAERFTDAIGTEVPVLATIRVLLEEGPEAAYADLQTRVPSAGRERWDRSIVGDDLRPGQEITDEHVYDIVLPWSELPEGTLGREFREFYDRNRLPLPGEPSTRGGRRPASWRLFHDMGHVIAGYGTTGLEELALTAMKSGLVDSDENWAALMNAFGVYEAGMQPGFATAEFEAKTRALARPGAVEFLADAFRRGRRCRRDFSCTHHVAMADWPLDRVRDEFGVPPTAAALPV